ncbi:Uncharacterised protein [Vibrio cholerae]|nr:Uncharacterised protein [Vibrio cholerae]
MIASQIPAAVARVLSMILGWITEISPSLCSSSSSNRRSTLLPAPESPTTAKIP